MKHLLLIEDNDEIRDNTAEILELAGYKVTTAENGKVGVEKAIQEKPDLIICDIMMPVLDGLSATRQVRDRESRLRLPRVPIVAMTANAFDEDVTASMAAGMDGHLAKPYSREQLFELLRRWL